jgi:phage N-6-adenine-methyltransferase
MKQFGGRTDTTRDDWGTPQHVLAAVEYMAKEPIKYDAFCTPRNAVAEMVADNSLVVDWPLDGLIFANPPYGSVLPMVASHIVRQVERGCRVVVLVPASTGSTWWHVLLGAMEPTFLLGRVSFIDPAGKGRSANNHNSCLFFSPQYKFPRTLRTASTQRMRRKHNE